jgi:predicted amidohydrolase
MAAGQCGTHPDGRQTYGHSLIIGPWGEIIAEAGEEPGIILADLDLDQVAAARGKIPALRHDRDYALPS